MPEGRLNELWAELRRRKVIRVAAVYVVAAWVAVEAASVIFPALLFPEWTPRIVVALALVGFPLAVGLAWAFEVRPERDPPIADLSATQEPVGEERLDGWKRIAAHLNRDVRTARRWEKSLGLPVRRVMHDKQATVYAYRSELDAWIRTRDTRAGSSRARPDRLPGSRLRLAWLAIPLVLIGVYLAWSTQQAEDQPIAWGEWDWALVTHFDNRTGDEMLEGMVEFALQRELSNSQFVKVVPQNRVNAALRLMKLPPDSPVDLQTGREISLRDGDIRILVGGRIEKTGNTYLITAQLFDPEDGVALASFSSESSNEDDILPGVAQLARDVRAALGESLSSIEESAQLLSKATTPSLEALRLYSEAERMMRNQERNQAVPVLEQALRIDPDFASAHLLLVYVLRDRDEPERAREHLQRAFELAEQTSERERLFILATYYRYLDDTPREIEAYKLLTRLHPDHQWANNNLANLLSWQGKPREAYPYKLRQAEISPNDEWSHYVAAMFAVANGERETAESLLARARSLADYPWFNNQVSFFPLHAAWVEGDYARVVRQADDIIDKTPRDELIENGQAFAHLRSLFQSLGMLQRLSELSAMRSQPGWLDAMVDLESGNRETLDQYLDGDVSGFWGATLMAVAGRNEKARDLIDDPRSVEELPPPFLIRDWRNLAKGQLALVEGRFEEAVTRFESSRYYLSISASHANQFAVHSLASAYVGLEQTDTAIQVLEETREQGPLTIFSAGATWFWLRNQVLLYELYRDDGRAAEAAVVAGQIRDHLRIADSDHPFLKKLR